MARVPPGTTVRRPSPTAAPTLHVHKPHTDVSVSLCFLCFFCTSLPLLSRFSSTIWVHLSCYYFIFYNINYIAWTPRDLKELVIIYATQRNKMVSHHRAHHKNQVLRKTFFFFFAIFYDEHDKD